MADLKASAILQYGDPIFGRVTLAKKTAGDDLQIGDFLNFDTSGVEKMSAATDDATFIGVCGTLSEDADGPDQIMVYLKAIVEVPTESATYIPGQSLSMNASNGTLETASPDANTIAHSLEYKTSATSLKVLVDVVSLQKLFSVAA